MSAVPSIGRAARIESRGTAGAETTSDLFERFSGQIFGYCLHQLGSREEAEDAVQTTFMNALRGLQRGIVPRVESAWLFKIAHNVCLSRRRSSFRRGRVEAPNNLEVLQEIVPAHEQAGEELMRLQDVLEQMPESQRRAILLREWQGLSYREIAEELELTQAAVETLIFRARRALAAGLEEEPVARPEWHRRARHGVDAGGVLAAVKTLLGSGAAAKVALTIAAVATSAVVAASAVHHKLPWTHRSAPAVPAQAAQRPPAPSSVLFAHSVAQVPSRTPDLAVSKHVSASARKPGSEEGDAPSSLHPAATAQSAHAAPVAAHGPSTSSPTRRNKHVLKPQTKPAPATAKPAHPANASQHGNGGDPGNSAPTAPGHGK